MIKLSDAAEGACLHVTAVEGSERFLARVTSIGITIGCPLQVIQNVPRRPVLVHCRDTAVAIDRSDCAFIQVEEEK